MGTIFRFFDFHGRLSRADWLLYLFAAAITCSAFGSLAAGILGPNGANFFAVLFLAAACSFTIRRLHDCSASGKYLFWLLLPVVGPAILLVKLVQRGVEGTNRYGSDPRSERDYLKVADSGDSVVNDVSSLNPIQVSSIVFPSNVDEIVRIVRSTDLPLSIGGGHFSMGGTTASPGSIHIDMRKMNRVLAFNPEARLIRVQAGIIDPALFNLNFSGLALY